MLSPLAGDFLFFLCSPAMGSLIYQGPNTVNQFRVYSVEYCTGTDDNNDPYVAIRFSFSRDLLGAFLTAFLPFMVCTFFLSCLTPPFLNRQSLRTGFPARQIWILVSEQRSRHYYVMENGWYHSFSFLGKVCNSV